jgi:hypothetical protein
MNKLVGLFIVSLQACSLQACGWDSPAPLQKPQPGYPCGTGYHSCANGSCCGIGWICGGVPEVSGCPAGSCCFVGGVERQIDAGPE